MENDRHSRIVLSAVDEILIIDEFTNKFKSNPELPPREQEYVIRIRTRRRGILHFEVPSKFPINIITQTYLK